MNPHNAFHILGRGNLRLLWLPLIMVVCCSFALAGETTFSVTDPSGAELKDALVIVQDMRVRDADEVFRALTDEHGRVPSRQLPDGLYRIIVTTPYGLCKTHIHEFLIGPESTEIQVSLNFLPTHGYGDIVPIHQRRVTVKVSERDGTPAREVEIHVRDEDATFYTRQWRKTDEHGEATIIEVGSDMVLVIVANGRVITREVPAHSQLVAIQLP
jgi:hypothetical protein